MMIPGMAAPGLTRETTPMRTTLLLIGIGVLLLAARSGPAGAAPPVDAVPAKAFPNAQQTQLAVTPSGRVYLTFGSGNAVYCMASADGGTTFGEPAKVGDLGALALGMGRGPRVAATLSGFIAGAFGFGGKNRAS